MGPWDGWVAGGRRGGGGRPADDWGWKHLTGRLYFLVARGGEEEGYGNLSASAQVP